MQEPNKHATLASLFTAIANAIRGKTGSSATIIADDFPDAIAAIPTGGIPNLQNKTVISNGTVTADSGYDGLGTVTVAIPVYDGTVTTS